MKSTVHFKLQRNWIYQRCGTTRTRAKSVYLDTDVWEGGGVLSHSPGRWTGSQLASTLGDRDEWNLKEQGKPDRSSRDTVHLLRKRPGLAGLRDREEGLDRERSGSAVNEHIDERSHLAVVACGPRLEETLTMLKSAVLFSKKPLHFYIFAEDNLHDSFRSCLDSWPRTVQKRFKFTIYPITFPKENVKEWKKLFKPCASQRLFLPLILKDVDSLLYVDTDILFLQSVEDIWTLLSQFNSSHLAAMAPEHEEPRIGWYNRFARHPYYGKTGINSGVMLMNMTRLREKRFKNDMTTVALRWEEILMPLLQKYKLNITWGDQDLLNIIFHHNPESLYVFPCQWNYRPDHCIYGSNCQQAEKEGVFILHGNRGVYHDDKQPAFRAIYEAIQKYPFGENMEASLLWPLEASLQTTTHTYCGRASHLFTKRLKQSIMSVQQDITQRRQSGHHFNTAP
ncbi:glucoside xylosyltransferase 1-like isoform X3 [Xiphias gladius]|uniref:glucoside xylosyltransferase 1-like isoform X3 n=1 Tax=Xiphias gladius TaxID=8245 RepID=UPI001A991ABB|nr:glucoside xylosyltransferase 1-like isoform X3 [Xiphias gladius]